MFRVRLINYLILPKSMGFDCLRDLVNKNIKLRLCDLNSDSLVNDQFLREISYDMTFDASYITDRETNLSFFQYMKICL